MKELEFSIGELQVGIFEESQYPKGPGHYRYQPYRGPGHLEMQEKLRSGGIARCHYGNNKEQVHFTVTSCPEYGVLELTNFEHKTNIEA